MIREKVVIIGGGLSGTLMSIALANRPDGPEIILLEKNPETLGRGVAYHHDFTHQPLNVVAAGMSLYADKPMHFYEWLVENRFRYSHLLPSIYPKVFVPRKIFGDYITENLEQIQLKIPGRFQIRIDEATAINKNGNLFNIQLKSGIEIESNHVILALGNFPPADFLPENHAVNNDARYFSNPWNDKIYSNLNGDESVLLLGTGLTAVDVILGLKVRGFRGKITMISRRGKLPLPHDLSANGIIVEYPGHLHPRDAFFWLRNVMEQNKLLPLTAVIDSIRPLTQQFWISWSNQEKKYFLKRLRPFWEVIRHRIPPASKVVLENLVYAEQLIIGKGEILEAAANTDSIHVKYSFNNRVCNGNFNKVINCTGPESNYRKVKFPIIQQLIQTGKVSIDPLGLGIDCTTDGHILNTQKEPVNGLWCLGPMRKAVLWETTALREIRDQVQKLAALIAARPSNASL